MTEVASEAGEGVMGVVEGRRGGETGSGGCDGRSDGGGWGGRAAVGRGDGGAEGD